MPELQSDFLLPFVYLLMICVILEPHHLEHGTSICLVRVVSKGQNFCRLLVEWIRKYFDLMAR